MKQYLYHRSPREEEWEKGAEDLFEQIKAENFPNLGKETDIQVQEAQRTPLKTNKNRSTLQHIIVKLAKHKDKERILKARREWQEIINVLNGKNMQPRILYPARLSFRVEGEIKGFPEK
ncbi:Hypothetical predicted protein [Lynx pardinus]|uniref:L1 transposable element dsRBD-like domain-containing protein n=1 Tax=Lynx pardinus TaxID=191816 RepID=A0A485N6H9_LYNPA|nr:Hypothetical predicted protein [Lynx pardinus]